MTEQSDTSSHCRLKTERHKHKPQFINLPLVSMSEAHLTEKNNNKKPKLDYLLIYER